MPAKPVSTEPGASTVTFTPCPPHLEHQAGGEVVEGGLAGAIGGETRDGVLPGQRRDHEHVPAAAREVGERRPGQAEDRGEVRADDVVPDRVGGVGQVREGAHPGVVDQDLQAAVRRHRAPRRRARGRWASRRSPGRASAVPPPRGRRRPRARPARLSCARPPPPWPPPSRQGEGDGAADTAPRTGHEGRGAAQLHRRRSIALEFRGRAHAILDSRWTTRTTTSSSACPRPPRRRRSRPPTASSLAQFHPDMNQGDKKAEARFKEIGEANEVLSDAEKRKRYDELGANWQAYERSARSGGAAGLAGRRRFPRRGQRARGVQRGHGRVLRLLQDLLRGRIRWRGRFRRRLRRRQRAGPGDTTWSPSWRSRSRKC